MTMAVEISKHLILAKMIPSERASQEEHNGANFSFIAPSTVEYKDHRKSPRFR